MTVTWFLECLEIIDTGHYIWFPASMVQFYKELCLHSLEIPLCGTDTPRYFVSYQLKSVIFSNKILKID